MDPDFRSHPQAQTYHMEHRDKSNVAEIDMLTKGINIVFKIRKTNCHEYKNIWSLVEFFKSNFYPKYKSNNFIYFTNTNEVNNRVIRKQPVKIYAVDLNVFERKLTHMSNDLSSDIFFKSNILQKELTGTLSNSLRSENIWPTRIDVLNALNHTFAFTENNTTGAPVDTYVNCYMRYPDHQVNKNNPIFRHNSQFFILELSVNKGESTSTALDLTSSPRSSDITNKITVNITQPAPSVVVSGDIKPTAPTTYTKKKFKHDLGVKINSNDLYIKEKPFNLCELYKLFTLLNNNSKDKYKLDSSENEKRVQFFKSENVISRFNIDLTTQHLRCLDITNWLNDEVINMYLSLVVETKPLMFCTSSAFFVSMVQKGIESQEIFKWYKHDKLFELKYLFIPIHMVPNHWIGVYVDFKNKYINYMDSFGNVDYRVAQWIMWYLKKRHKIEKGSDLIVGDWEFYNSGRTCPQQTNAYDCGVFVCQYFRHIANNVQLTFTQRDIVNIRSEMQMDLINGIVRSIQYK